jgi:hypothetical protein
MTSRGVQRVTAAAPNLSRSEPGRRRRPAAAAAGTPVTETRTSSVPLDASLVFNVILTLDAIIAVD